jgi:uncharacterized delta-60 repeat protein
VATPTDGELRALALDGSGNVVAVGTSTGSLVQQLTVVRFLPTGALDTKFAGGLVRLSNVDAPQGSNGYAVAIGMDGSVIAAGSSKIVGGENAIAVRFKSDGTRDATFGTGGILTIAKNRFVGASIEPGGAIVLGGTDETATFTYFLTRRTATGAADPAFGTAGVSTFGSGFRAQAFARLPDGSFALAGDAQGGGQYTAGVASNAGAMAWDRAPALATGGSFFGVAAQPDGQLIVAGYAPGATAEARVMRLAGADGTIDGSFGNGGTTILAARPGSAFDVTLFAALVQPDGRILVAGNKSNGGATLFRLWP